MPLPVVHISFSSSGGAGGVASILAEAQRETGRLASVYSVLSTNLRSEPLLSPRHTLAAIIDQYLVKEPGFRAPVSLFRDTVSPPMAKALSSAEVIHLHGINGIVQLSQIRSRFPDTKIVWTLHDMNPFTGACHYSLGCQGFENDCSACPAVRPTFQSKVAVALRNKASALRDMPTLSIVSPSDWLTAEAARSHVMKDFRIVTIPNPIAPVFVNPRETMKSNSTLRDYRAVVVARNLDDPVKNVGFAVETFREAFHDKAHAHLTLIGEGGKNLEGPGVSVIRNASSLQIAQCFANSDALIVSSLAENSPLVISEAASQGCKAFVSSVGGMPGLVANLQTGGVYESKPALLDLLRDDDNRQPEERSATRSTLRDIALELYSPASIAREYDKVYQ